MLVYGMRHTLVLKLNKTRLQPRVEMPLSASLIHAKSRHWTRSCSVPENNIRIVVKCMSCKNHCCAMYVDQSQSHGTCIDPVEQPLYGKSLQVVTHWDKQGGHARLVGWINVLVIALHMCMYYVNVTNSLHQLCWCGTLYYQQDSMIKHVILTKPLAIVEELWQTLQ